MALTKVPNALLETPGGTGLTIEVRDATGGLTLNENTQTIITANDGSLVSLPASGSDLYQEVYNRTGANLTVARAGADTINTGTTFAIADGKMAAFAIDSTQTDWSATTDETAGSPAWGAIIGTLGDQSDLQAALDAKQNILSEGAFVDGDKTKLDGIETGAVAAGATGDAHAGSTSNPHSVTAAQVGAATTATKLDDFATPDDNTDLNASTSRHGLLPKLSGVSTEYLNGAGAFSTPASGSGDIANVADDEYPVTIARSVSSREALATHYSSPTTLLQTIDPAYPLTPVVVDSGGYLLRTSNFANCPDTRKITLAALVKFDTISSPQYIIGAGFKVEFTITSSVFKVVLKNNVGTQVASFTGASTVVAGVWYQVVFSADLDAQTAVLLVNGRDDLSTSTYDLADDVDTGGTSKWAIGADARTTVGNFMDGQVDRATVWLDYIDLNRNRELFWKGGKPQDYSLDLMATRPVCDVKGPAATFEQNRAGMGDFTETGTLTDGATVTATGYWQTSGTVLYGPDGNPTPLRGWRILADQLGSNQNGGPLSREYFRSLKAQGIAGNSIAIEIWWSSKGTTGFPNPGEPTPSAPGVYQEEYLWLFLETMANAAAEGLWLVPSIRVSYDEAEAATNLAADNVTGNAWQGWADHDLVISNAAVASPGTGNYRDRFFAWITWLVGKILARKDIAPAVAYWEMWHYPFHRHGTPSNAEMDAYLDTGASGFAKLMTDHYRSLVGSGPLLGFSMRTNALPAYVVSLGGSWSPVDDDNVIYITGGAGHFDALLTDPPSALTFPNDCTSPSYDTGTGKWNFQRISEDKNIAFHCQEGPYLLESLRDNPLNATAKAFLQGMFNVYNQYANGWTFHSATLPLDDGEEWTEFGTILRRALLGSQPVTRVASYTGWVNAADFGFSTTNTARRNLLAMDAAIKWARLTKRGLYVPGGVYPWIGTFSLSGHDMTTDSNGTSGWLANDMLVFFDRVTLKLDPAAVATDFHECKAWSYVSAGVPTSGYKSVSDLVLRTVEPWDDASEAPITNGVVAGTSVGVKKYCVFDTRGIQGSSMWGLLHIQGNFDGSTPDNIVAFGCSQRGLQGNDGQRVTWPHLIIEDMEMGLYATPRFGTDASTAAPDDGFADCFTAGFFPHIETRGNIGRAMCIGPNKMDGSFIARATLEGQTCTSRIHQTGAQFGSLRINHKIRNTTQYAAMEITKSEVSIAGECYTRNNGSGADTKGAAYFFRVGDEAALRIGALRYDNTDLNASYASLIYVGGYQNGLQACTKAMVDVFGTYDLAARADLESIVRLETDQSSGRNRQINVRTNLAWADAVPVDLDDTGGSSTGDVIKVQTNDTNQQFKVIAGRLAFLNPNILAMSNTRQTIDGGDEGTTLTAMLTATIPQHAISEEGGRIKITLMGDCSIQGSDGALRFTCTIGATTEFDATTEVMTAAAGDRAWMLVIDLIRRGTSTWGTHAALAVSENGTDTTGRGTWGDGSDRFGGVIARVSHAGPDLSTGSVSLVVSVALPNTHADTRVRCDNYFVEKAA